MFKVLVLGGTTQAMQLAHLLAGDGRFNALFSLAGRTSQPVIPPIATRIGGFGGVEGLTHFLQQGGFCAVVDATHPFAAQMSHHAAMACVALALPLCILSRPAWQPGVGDDWVEVADLPGAALALGQAPRRVMLTTGRLGIEAFQSVMQHHYLIRSIDPLNPAPPLNHTALIARPPFTVKGETALMRRYNIDVLVTKNSGAQATQAKLAAARNLCVPVIMVQRPKVPDVLQLPDAVAVMQWLAQCHATAPTERGV